MDSADFRVRLTQLGREKREAPQPDNESFDPPEPVRLGPAAGRATRLEGSW